MVIEKPFMKSNNAFWFQKFLQVPRKNMNKLKNLFPKKLARKRYRLDQELIFLLVMKLQQRITRMLVNYVLALSA